MMILQRSYLGAAVVCCALCGSVSAGPVLRGTFGDSGLETPTSGIPTNETLLATVHVSQGGQTTASGDVEAQFVLTVQRKVTLQTRADLIEVDAAS